VELSYTDEQELFRKSVRQFATERVTPERLAEIADGPDGWDPALWKEAVELGLSTVSIPQDLGGAGLGFVEEAIVAEELGRVVFPGPWLGAVVLSLPALSGQLLQRVATGRHVTTLLGLTAPFVAEGSAIMGRAEHVVDLAAADQLVVLTHRGVFAVDRDQTDWRVLPTADGTRRLGQVALDGTPGVRLSGPDPALAGNIRVRALAALAAEAVGVASRAVELAVEYARDRQQFGRAIGSFQAVSHQIADAFMDAELARSLTMWAAAAIEGDGPDAPAAVATAKWFAADAAVRACERSIQVHGGIGFTWEHVLHRCYKRALWIAAYPDTGPALRSDVSRQLLA
jgi:alkylation response protein AidB-like acyl-CoA dehydrogenase